MTEVVQIDSAGWASSQLSTATSASHEGRGRSLAAATAQTFPEGNPRTGRQPAAEAAGQIERSEDVSALAVTGFRAA